MKTHFTILLLFVSLSSYCQTVLTYKDVFDFSPGEVIGRQASFTYPVPSSDPLSPPFYEMNTHQVFDSIMSKTVFSNNDSVQYQIHRRKILGQMGGGGFQDTSVQISVVTVRYNYREVPIANLMLPLSSNLRDTTFVYLGGGLPGFRFTYRLNSVMDSSWTYIKGLGGPYISANISRSTFFYSFLLVKKNGLPRLVNPAFITSSEQSLQIPKQAVFPIPAENELVVSNIVGEIKIIDLFGKTHLEGYLSEKNSVLDVRSLSPGVYYLQAGKQNNASPSMFRFIKK